MATTNPDYCRDSLPPEITEKLEAGAFRSLCEHLQDRSDAVSNMELMTISGFCRNCLAKWMVLEARRLVDNESTVNDESVKESLNALGYDQAAQHVYGMGYPEWKKRFQKKASQDEVERYNASKPIHAQHDKDLLATRAEAPAQSSATTAPSTLPGANQNSSNSNSTLLSNVCCQDVETKANEKPAEHIPKPEPKKSREVGPFVPPALPTIQADCKLAILTVSDRAFKNEYESGDLSGPAVAQAVQAVADLMPSETAIVPDSMEAIQSKIVEWSNAGFALILTTGGTGLSPRDVTPEATRAILDHESAGLMAFCTTECSRQQPLASLSRGTAGVRGKTMIANLPGNPKGVGEVIPILLPLLLHAVVDLQKK